MTIKVNPIKHMSRIWWVK